MLSGLWGFLPCPSSIQCLHWCKGGLVPWVISDLQVTWFSLTGIRREWGTVTVMGLCALGSYTGPVNTELSNAHSLFLYMQTRACSMRKHTALSSTCPTAWDMNGALRAANEMLGWLNSLAKLWSFPGDAPLGQFPVQRGEVSFFCILPSQLYDEKALPSPRRDTVGKPCQKWAGRSWEPQGKKSAGIVSQPEGALWRMQKTVTLVSWKPACFLGLLGLLLSLKPCSQCGSSLKAAR